MKVKLSLFKFYVPCCLRSRLPHRPSAAWLSAGAEGRERERGTEGDSMHWRGCGSGLFKSWETRKEEGKVERSLSLIFQEQSSSVDLLLFMPPSSGSSPFPPSTVSWSISLGAPLHTVPRDTAASGEPPPGAPPPAPGTPCPLTCAYSDPANTFSCCPSKRITGFESP